MRVGGVAKIVLIRLDTDLIVFHCISSLELASKRAKRYTPACLLRYIGAAAEKFGFRMLAVRKEGRLPRLFLLRLADPNTRESMQFPCHETLSQNSIYVNPFWEALPVPPRSSPQILDPGTRWSHHTTEDAHNICPKADLYL